MSGLPKSCVVDASVGVKLLVSEVGSNKAERLFADESAELCVPDLFFVECTNVLWKKVRTGMYRADDALADMSILEAMRLAVTPTSELTRNAFTIACAQDVSAYDACYVALAERLGVPLVTADTRLARKLQGRQAEVVDLIEIDE